MKTKRKYFYLDNFEHRLILFITMLINQILCVHDLEFTLILITLYHL